MKNSAGIFGPKAVCVPDYYLKSVSMAMVSKKWPEKQ